MRLQRLRLKNFRQFRDDTVEFAAGDDGVTVVHGSNGSGKTTLLNAFTWVLYGEVDFDTRPDRLASEGAMAAADPGDTVTVAVELDFVHDGAEYHVRRYREYEKQGETDLDGEADEGGVRVVQGENGEPVGNPEDTLDRVIPERLSELFFFDGEDIDELAGIDNQERVQEAIENLMGLTILERAVRHLDTVAGRFKDDVQEFASDELSAVSEKIDKVRREIEKLESAKQDAEQQMEKAEQKIREIEGKIEGRQEAKALADQRKRHREAEQSLEAEIESINDDLRGAVNDKAPKSLAVPLVRETAEELNKMREEGSIQAGVDNDFLESLIKTGTCVCGRDIEPGTVHHRNIQQLQRVTVADGVEEVAMQIISHLEQFSTADSAFEEQVSDLYETRQEKREKLKWRREKISEISSELSAMDSGGDQNKSVGELEDERKEKEELARELSHEIGERENEVQEEREKIESLESKFDTLNDEREKALLAKRRRKATLEVKEDLQVTYDQVKDKVRKNCNKLIGQTFDEVADKALTAEVDDEFRLRITQSVGDQSVEVDKSTGERQIASLAFVGSLVKLARVRYESDTQSQYFSGGIYPLVMDSPFGALDKSHRRKVSSVVPEMGNQVVVFATDSQWEGPVEDEMSDHIGQQYWLNFDPGDGDGSYPKTRILAEQAAVRGD